MTIFVLRRDRAWGVPRTIDAIEVLSKTGRLSLVDAKRAIEDMVGHDSVFIRLPDVENVALLMEELAELDVAAAVVDTASIPDVAALRTRLGLTPEQFALAYGLEVDLVHGWESGTIRVDPVARSYLQAICNDSRGVERAYAPAGWC